MINTWIESGVAWIEFARPTSHNALNTESLRAVDDALGDAADRDEARVIVLTGAGGRAFVAGADLQEMNSLDSVALRHMIELGQQVTRRIEESPLPVIAAVNGFALGGGCEIALAADIVLAAENAVFALPEVGLGVLPGWGGTQRLERRVGYGLARLMILTGRRIPAAEALSMRLCEAVHPASELRRAAQSLAEEIAARDPGSVSGARRALRFGHELPHREALAREADLFCRLFDRPERTAAMEPFLKRKG